MRLKARQRSDRDFPKLSWHRFASGGKLQARSLWDGARLADCNPIANPRYGRFGKSALLDASVHTPTRGDASHASALFSRARCPVFLWLPLVILLAGLLHQGGGAHAADALTIGGIVHGATNEPVSGAVVIISGPATDGNDRAGGKAEIVRVKTGADGRWSSDRFTNGFTNLTFSVRHPEYQPADFDQAGPGGEAPGMIPTEALAKGRAIFALEPGFPVIGLVTDARGRPLRDASVVLGKDIEWPIRTTRTDDAGRFRMVVPRRGTSYVAAFLDGFAPIYDEVKIGAQTTVAHLRLTAGKILRGRVMNSEGEPIAGARVLLKHWNGYPLLRWETETGVDGTFTWEKAPAGTLAFTISKSGYIPAKEASFGVVPEEEWVVELERAFMVTGRVVDAASQSPIPEFTVTPGYLAGLTEDEAPTWDAAAQFTATNGVFRFILEERRSEKMKFLIRAEGYLPGASAALRTIGWHEVELALKKGTGPVGVVRTRDGRPVANATVAALEGAPITLGRSALSIAPSSSELLIKSDREGRFELPPVVENPMVVAVHELGYARSRAGVLQASGKLVLEPWGSVAGTLKIGAKPAAGEWVMITPRPSAGPSLNYDIEAFKALTDEEGRFEIQRVPPGEHQLVRLIPLGPENWAWSHNVPVLVKAGEPTRVTSGGTGRPVTGRILLEGTGIDMDWENSGQHSLVTRLPEAPATLRTREELERWYNSPEMTQARANQRHFLVRISTNATFRIEDIPAGAYELRFQLTQPDPGAAGATRAIGALTHAVTVPEMPAGRSDEPLDLGALTIAAYQELRIGSAAPDFEISTVDEKPLKLSSYRGKFVLLFFWATWCEPCVAELATLKTAFHEFADDERFALIGLSLDSARKTAGDFATEQGMRWVQGFLGDPSLTQIPAAYGLTAIPAIFLINPEGRIIGRRLRGPNIVWAVTQALREHGSQRTEVGRQKSEVRGQKSEVGRQR